MNNISKVPNISGFKMARYQICAENDIPVGEMKEFAVGGESLLIYHLEGGFYTTQSRCTHLFGPLQKGKIINGNKSNVRGIILVLIFAQGRLLNGLIIHLESNY